MSEIENKDVVYENVNNDTRKEEFELEKNSSYESHKAISTSHARCANSSSVTNKKYYILVAVTVLLLVTSLVSSAVAWYEILQFKSEIVVNMRSSEILNKIENLSHEVANSTITLNENMDMLQQQRYEIASLESSIDTLNERIEMYQHKSEIASSINTLNESLELLNQQFNVVESNIENVTQFINGLLSSPPVFPANSCADVLLLAPSALSDYYWIRSSNGSAVYVYCDMTISCGGVTGGWMRVAKLDMRDNSSQCPSGLQQHIDSDIRTCLMIHTALACTCSSTAFPTDAFSYSRVCGMIKGYQFGTPDAFYNHDPYCYHNDGIMLTHGNPRQHIWTFAAGVSETANHLGRCPCFMDGPSPPSFVGNDYFCDTGNKESVDFTRYLYQDPLWDGINCSNSTCCSFNNPPWFYKQLPEHTIDDIEMRICRDQLTSDENLAIEQVEIYIN